MKALVAKFSDIREFDKYVDLVTVLDEKSDRAYKKELKSDEKTKKRTDELDAKSERLKQLIFDTKMICRISRESQRILMFVWKI